MSTNIVPVIQLIDGFAVAEQSGGAALFALNLARHLNDACFPAPSSPSTNHEPSLRFRPIVCGLWRHNTPSEDGWRAKIEAVGIPTAILIENRGNLEADMIRALHRLNRLVAQQNVQLINSHFERCDLLALACKVQHGGRPKIVRTVHAERQWLSRPWLGNLLNLLAYPRFFDAEVAIAQGTQAMLDQRQAAQRRNRKAHLIYNGLNPEFVTRLDEVPREKNASGPRLIIVGRLEEQKGHATLIAAMPEILRHLPAAILTVVGVGSLHDQLIAQSHALGVNQATRFLGGRDDIPLLLRQHDIFVSASNWEGFPTVVLEAMAAELPVVATDVGGSRELVRDGQTGYLVPPRDPTQLAAAILRLWDNQAMARQMTAAAHEQMQPFLFPNIAVQYGALYREALGI